MSFSRRMNERHENRRICALRGSEYRNQLIRSLKSIPNTPVLSHLPHTNHQSYEHAHALSPSHTYAPLPPSQQQCAKSNANSPTNRISQATSSPKTALHMPPFAPFGKRRRSPVSLFPFVPKWKRCQLTKVLSNHRRLDSTDRSPSNRVIVVSVLLSRFDERVCPGFRVMPGTPVYCSNGGPWINTRIPSAILDALRMSDDLSFFEVKNKPYGSRQRGSYDIDHGLAIHI